MHRPVVQHPTAGEQPVVREEQPVRPGRVDETTQGGHVVDEPVPGFDEDDVGQVVQHLGGEDAAVPAPDDGHGRAHEYS